MLTTNKIQELFFELNNELKEINITGEIGICGGAVMCLVFKTRCSTKDVDGIFAPAKEMRKAIMNVGNRLHIEKDWLNDAAKGFFTNNIPTQDVINYSNLRVWAPTAEYMLAMKCISARYDGYDKEDLIFLIKYLELHKPDEVFNTITKYYPEDKIPIKTKFFVEEICNSII